ncbi:hypothetical protein J5X98_07115 [Leptothermofonsia sichuanensis E412]|uniref:hypothetical protein n=1 Tax=Leptothermofonsia sichuanensis TaxID=2917832 RepID=UPI001CA62327|nr:hypothetical protein [Leptothermofonsia sichuanensis]QZZ22157.1 hypothetical protein J5X98_07115 [Leptothermofonsia sichuanensis E412]
MVNEVRVELKRKVIALTQGHLSMRHDHESASFRDEEAILIWAGRVSTLLATCV